jgi:large subunit ribosomal protein L31
MKSNIHPKYYDNCKVTCACGNTFTTGSTLPEIKVDICAACHPFFTGEQKYVDTLGRVEKFKQRQAQAAQKKYVKKSDRQKLKAQKEEKQTPKSLKEMLQKK